MVVALLNAGNGSLGHARRTSDLDLGLARKPAMTVNWWVAASSAIRGTGSPLARAWIDSTAMPISAAGHSRVPFSRMNAAKASGLRIASNHGRARRSKRPAAPSEPSEKCRKMRPCSRTSASTTWIDVTGFVLFRGGHLHDRARRQTADHGNIVDANACLVTTASSVKVRPPVIVSVDVELDAKKDADARHGGNMARTLYSSSVYFTVTFQQVGLT